MEWPRGEATACKAVYTGSNPVSTSEPRSNLRGGRGPRAISSVGERFLDTEEVTGSIPVSPTTKSKVRAMLRDRASSTTPVPRQPSATDEHWAARRQAVRARQLPTGQQRRDEVQRPALVRACATLNPTRGEARRPTLASPGACAADRQSSYQAINQGLGPADQHGRFPVRVTDGGRHLLAAGSRGHKI